VDLDVGDTDSNGDLDCSTMDAYLLGTMVHIGGDKSWMI